MRLASVPLAAWPVGALFFLAFGLTWVERGSIERGDWLPYSFGAAIVLAALLLSERAVRCSRAIAFSVGALFALAVWDAITLAWSPTPSLGHDEPLLVLTLALAFTAVVLSATGTAARAATAACAIAFSGSTALAISLVTLSQSNPTDLYRDGRLEAPIGYTNALAAVFLLGFWPAIGVAAHRSTPWPLRAASLGAAAAMLAGELQAPSKGAGAAIVLTGVVLLAVSPGRLRLVVPLAIVAVCLLPAVDSLTEPFRLQQGTLAAEISSIEDSATTLLLVAAAATLAGLVYAFADSRLTLSHGTVRAINRVGLAVLGVAAAAAVVAAVASAGRIEDWVSARWDEFGNPAGQQLDSTSNFGSLGSSRLDSWEVAAREFADRPIVGNGTRSFQAAYLLHGETRDTPERSHSLIMDTLSETGLIGFVLLLGALAPPLWLMLRRARRSLIEASLFAAALAWVAQASVDWIWTLPAVSLAVAVFVPPWLSARFTESGLAEGRAGSGAFTWAERLDPFAIEPLLAEADVAASPAEAIPILRQAVRKEPESAALHYFLGRRLAAAGRRREALVELERARRLYPRGPEILDALRRVRESG